MKTAAELLTGPSVSSAIGWKRYAAGRPEYLSVFFVAANSAAEPAQLDDADKYDSAKVVVTVTSHVSALPFCQGTRVSPSGRLPSFRDRPDGSFTTGTPADVKARVMISFTAKCLVDRAGAFLHTIACRPQVSTLAPQRHSCATHKWRPNLSATATRTASSSSRRPQDAIGKAASQAPL